MSNDMRPPKGKAVYVVKVRWKKFSAEAWSALCEACVAHGIEVPLPTDQEFFIPAECFMWQDNGLDLFESAYEKTKPANETGIRPTSQSTSEKNAIESQWYSSDGKGCDRV